MKSPFSKPRVAHHGQRNAFDMSEKAVFTASPGMLLPFFCKEVIPGDHVEIQNESFTRTQPVNTAAFVRMTEHREYFFVPYRYLWSYWQQFITHMPDFNSSTFWEQNGAKVPDTIPTLNLAEPFTAHTHLYNLVDHSGRSYAYNAIYLLNLLGYGNLFLLGYDPSSYLGDDAGANFLESFRNTNIGSSLNAVNPFRLLAYQKIFYDYYRKSDFDPSHPQAFNIDNVTKASNTSGSILYTEGRASLMFAMHYRPWKVDYFTSIRPSTYWYGSTSSSNPSFGITNTSLARLSKDFSGTDFNGSTPIGNNSMQVGIFSGIGTGTVNAQAVRVMFAVDKYLRTSQLAGKNYDDQILAHFGVKPNHDTAQQVSLLGAFSIPLVINEVESTSASGTVGTDSYEPLGSLAGKGIANGTSSGKPISFDAKEHGIIMGIYSVSVDSDYNSAGISPFNTKVRPADFYTPEYDELGPHVLRSFYYDVNDGNSAIGLIDPYLEYKTSVDKVYGSFSFNKLHKGDLSHWVAPRIQSMTSEEADDGVGRFFANTSSLYISPKVTDSIFLVSSSLADSILVNNYTRCAMVRNMSVHGSPSLH